MLMRRSLALSLTVVAALGLAASSHAKNQQYQGSLVIESFGNDNLTGFPNTGFFSVFGMPQGINCNKYQPRCPLVSTPTSHTTTAMGVINRFFDPDPACLGTVPMGKVCPTQMWQCFPYTHFGPMRATKSAKTINLKRPLGPPFYRNPKFFTPGGNPDLVSCTATTTVNKAACPPIPPATSMAPCGKAQVFLTTNSPMRGKVMKGKPLTGEQIVTLTGKTDPAGFYVKAAPMTPVKTPGPTGFGLRRTTSGEFNNINPYLYSYTYAKLYNDKGTFFAGGGPGAFDLMYFNGGMTADRVKVTAGAKKFGGVQRLLGELRSKVCYYRGGGCLLGGNNWQYDDIGRKAKTMGGVVTMGELAYATAYYYNTNLKKQSVIQVSGRRFPWTTGTAYVLAKYNQPKHDTVQERKGYDDRTEYGMGKIQLVTPVLTRWIDVGGPFDYTTVGIGVMRLEFVPEPGKLLLLVGGLSALAIVHSVRRRGRR